MPKNLFPLDNTKPFTEQKHVGHNRWHPDIPPAVSVRPGDVFRADCREWFDGAIWANVWQSDEIVRIDPASGAVTGVLDASGLLTEAERARVDVLNGIAWDAARRRLYVTGKLWPKLFALALEEPGGTS